MYLSIVVAYRGDVVLTFGFTMQDLNENGHIMYTEFLAATIEAHGHIEEERIAEAFDRLDSDKSGYSKLLVVTCGFILSVSC